MNSPKSRLIYVKTTMLTIREISSEWGSWGNERERAGATSKPAAAPKRIPVKAMPICEAFREMLHPAFPAFDERRLDLREERA